MIRYIITDGKFDFLATIVVMIKSWVLAFLLTPLVYVLGLLFGIVDRLILSEHDFMIALLIAMVFDTLMGLYKHWKTSSIDIKKFVIKTFDKLILVIVGMTLFNLLSYPIKKHEDIMNYYNMMAQLTLLSYPVFNAFKNMYIASKKKFPPEFIMKKLVNFNETGDVKNFYTNEKADNSTTTDTIVQSQDTTEHNADSN